MISSSESRARLLEAFNHLILGRKQGRPALREVIKNTGVARSTLYDHFGGRDDLLLEAIKTPLNAMADVGTGNGEAEALVTMLEHFRSRRQDALELLSGPLRYRINRTLAQMMRKRNELLNEKSAIILAEVLLGFVRLCSRAKQRKNQIY